MLKPALRPPMRAPMRSANSPREGVGWWQTGSLFDADYANGRFRYNGTLYPDEASFNTALGATKSGIARTFGPYVFGAELLTDPWFASGIDSWADAPTYAANGEPSQVSNALRLLFTGAATTYRARRPVAVTADHAYLLAATALSHVTLTSASLQGSTNTDLGGTATTGFTLASLPQSKSLVFGPNTSTMYLGIALTGTAAATTRLDLDDASAKECYPYNGFVVGAIASRIAFSTPASVPSAVVLAQWGDDSERQRVRLELGVDLHLHLIITRNNTETGNLDLGLLTVSTSYVAEVSFAPNRIVARVSGAASVQSFATTIPGIGKFWIGRSFTGETWTGTINQVAVWASEHLPRDVIWCEGDSYCAGAGGVSLTGSLQGLARPAVTTAVAGTNLSDQLARVLGKPGLAADGVFVHWDGSAVGNVDAATAMANYAAILASLGHSRFVIVPPVRIAINTAPNNALTTAIQTALVAAYPNNIVDAQAILASHATSPVDDADVAAGNVPTSLLQADNAHLTATGMGYVATAVKTLLTANGW